MSTNTAGWFYVGDGWLRFRHDGAWTEHYVLAEQVRGLPWPPAVPEGLEAPDADALHTPQHADSTRFATLRALGRALSARRRPTGRHRGVVDAGLV